MDLNTLVAETVVVIATGRPMSQQRLEKCLEWSVLEIERLRALVAAKGVVDADA